MTSEPISPRMIAAYCRRRLASHFTPLETEAVRRHLVNLAISSRRPPRSNGSYDWSLIAIDAGLSLMRVLDGKQQLIPVLDAITRAVRFNRTASAPARSPTNVAKPRTDAGNEYLQGASERAGKPRAKRTYRKKAIVEFPTPLWMEWHDPPSFSDALSLHMKRHGDTCSLLARAVAFGGRTIDLRALVRWTREGRAPRSVHSMEALGRIERRYHLPAGYFKAKLPNPSRAASGHILDEIGPAERRRLAWHLPDDFNLRSFEEQEEILAWVERVIIRGSTDYRSFMAAAIKTPYAVKFRAFAQQGLERRRYEGEADDEHPQSLCGVVDAPPDLDAEMSALLRFKTSALTELGLRRNGVWGDETACQKVEHFGLMFGALAASPLGPIRGRGVPPSQLCMAMLAVPSVWDWYLQWRMERRGFFTTWEVDMLSVCLALIKVDTGWMRQTPSLAARLAPVPGLVTDEDVARAADDWGAACDAMHRHAHNRIKEISRITKVHRDPFEPILAVLEADSPVAEYRRITDEILRLMPDEQRYPRQAAEAVRSFLMLRIGLHAGLRQRNLRELRICQPQREPATERQLEHMKCGEIRWSDREAGWEILIPSVAFKNASSSFFGKKPFRLVLPNLAELYPMLEAYVGRHRATLLGAAEDPGTFFVKTAKRTSISAAYDQNTFYEAWRLTIQRYGIFNPYTGRGAIKGLLPHGPHNIRDVLATHILKKTGSYEQASYAIQDTPEMVSQHYGRFLPQDKAAIAAKVLNEVWNSR